MCRSLRITLNVTFAAAFMAASAAVSPQPLPAQSFGVGANYGLYTLNGEPFEAVETGTGYEAFIQLSPGGSGGGAGGAAGMGFGGGGFSIGVGIKRTFHGVEGGQDLETRTIFIAPGMNLAASDSRVRLSVRTRLSPFANIDFGENAAAETIESDGFELGGAVGMEIFLLSWLAVEPSVYGSYLNLEEPGVEEDEETTDPQQPNIPGLSFLQGERIQGWSLGARLGLTLIVH